MCTVPMPRRFECWRKMRNLAKQLHPELPYIAAEVVWARDGDGAQRRGRAGAKDAGLFLNARAAMQMALPVGRLLARELDRDDAWIAEQTKESANWRNSIWCECGFPGGKVWRRNART